MEEEEEVEVEVVVVDRRHLPLPARRGKTASARAGAGGGGGTGRGDARCAQEGGAGGRERGDPRVSPGAQRGTPRGQRGGGVLLLCTSPPRARVRSGGGGGGAHLPRRRAHGAWRWRGQSPGPPLVCQRCGASPPHTREEEEEEGGVPLLSSVCLARPPLSSRHGGRVGRQERGFARSKGQAARRAGFIPSHFRSTPLPLRFTSSRPPSGGARRSRRSSTGPGTPAGAGTASPPSPGRRGAGTG